MKNIRRNFSIILIFLVIAQTVIAQQQTEKRILVQEDQKKEATKKNDGPRAVRPELVLQTGITSPAAIIAFSPDGRLLASMSLYGGAINLWDVATGRELFVINLGDRDAMSSAFNSAFCFSPDGASLLSFCSGTIKQWETLTGRLIRSTAVKGNGFAFASFSADARSLVTASQTQQAITIWDASTGAQIQSVGGGLDSATYIHAAALSPDGRVLAAGEEDRVDRGDVTKLVLRDTTSGRITQSIKVTEEKMDKRPSTGSAFNSSQPVRVIRFSTDGRTVGMSIRDALYTQTIGAIEQPRPAGQLNQIKLWDAATGREIKSFTASTQGGSVGAMAGYGEASSFAFIADGKMCASITGEPSVKLFDAASGRNVSTLAGHAGEIMSIAFSSDGSQAATAGVDNTIKIWDIAAAATTGQVNVVRTFGNSAMPVTGMAYAQDGRSIAVGGNGAVNVWEMTTGDSLRTVTLPTVTLTSMEDLMGGPQAVAFSAGGRYVATGTAGAVKVWETKTGREVKSIPLAPGKKAGNAAVTRDGKMIALADPRPAMFGQSAQSTSATTQPSQTTNQTSQTTPAPPTDPNAQKQDDKKKAKDARKQQEEMLKQMQQNMKSGKMPDMAEMQKMAEAMQRGEIGKVQDMTAQMMSKIGIASPALPPPASIKLFDINSGNEIRSITGQQGTVSYSSPLVAFSANERLLAMSTGGRTIK
ncbi:MAG TPA: hypothetical protein VID27_14785, partial [Blastocatellia bacterium]